MCDFRVSLPRNSKVRKVDRFTRITYLRGDREFNASPFRESLLPREKIYYFQLLASNCKFWIGAFIVLKIVSRNKTESIVESR